MTWRSCFYHHLSFTDKETEPQNDFKKQNKTTLSYILGMGTSDAELWAQFWHQGPFHNHPLLCLTSCLWAPCTIKLQWYQTTLNSVNTSNCFKPLRFCMESPHQTLPLHGNKNSVCPFHDQSIFCYIPPSLSLSQCIITIHLHLHSYT